MEIQNQILYKNIVVKVKAETTEENLLRQLEVQNQHQELKLSMKNSDQQNMILYYINSTVSNNKEIISLAFKFHKIIGLNLDLILDQNFDFIHILSLSLEITDDFFIATNSELKLGENISKLTNLESFSIKIDFKYATQQFGCLSLNKAYKELKNMKNLKINLLNLEKNTDQFQNIIQGIQSLLSLNSLNIELGFLKNADLELYADQIQHLSNLTELSFKTEQQIQYTVLSIQEFGKSLQKLKKLSKLSLKIQTFLKDKSKDYLIDFIQSLNLSYLSYYVKNQTDNEKLRVLQIIQNLTSIQEIQLNVFSNSYEQQNEKKIFKIISNIQNLTSLTVYFSHSYLNQIKIFFDNIRLNKQINLKQLDIIISYLQEQPNILNPEQNEKELAQNNIEKFSLQIAYSNIQYFRLNEQLIHILQQLPKLQQLNLKLDEFSKNKVIKPIQINEIVKNNHDLTEFIFQPGNPYSFDLDDVNSFLQSIQLKNKLSKLDLIFDLKKNSLVDSFCINLSQTLSHLSEIKELNLQLGAKNNFKQEGINKLSESVQKLKHLKNLKLTFAKKSMEQGCFELLLKCISTLHYLKKLDFQIGKNNNIGKTLKYLNTLLILPPKLKQLKISLDENNFRYNNVKGLFEQVSKMKNLEILKIKIFSIQLENNDVIDMRNQLCSLKSISKLSLNFSQLNSFYLINLFDDLPYLKELSLLKEKLRNIYHFKAYSTNTLKQQNIQQQQLMQDTGIENNQQLQIINKDSQIKQFQQESEVFLNLNIRLYRLYTNTEKLEWSFQNIRNITRIKLIFNQNCQIDDKSTIQIFQTLVYLKNLNELTILVGRNSVMNGDCMAFFGNVLSNLTILKKLNVSVNDSYRFKWNKGIKFVEGFKSLNNLISLNLDIKYADSMGVDGYRLLLKNIGFLKNLEILQIDVIYQRTRIDLDKENVGVNDFYLNLHNLRVFRIDFQLFKFNNKDSIKQFYQNLMKMQNLQHIQIYYHCKQFNHYIKKIKRLVKCRLFQTYF